VRKKKAIKFVLWWKNWTKNRFLPYYPYIPKAKLRLKVLFKKFHGRINRTTLYSTKSYLMNTIKQILGHENRFLTKSQIPLQGGYPWEPEFQNSEYFVMFLDIKILDKSAVKFVLGWNPLNKIFIFPFWVGICMGGTLKTQSFIISSTKLSFKYKIAEQKCHQFCSLAVSQLGWLKVKFLIVVNMEFKYFTSPGASWKQV
jgi:hypothetical protein